MAKEEKKKRNWRDKYRFTIYNDTTFEEVWKVRLTRYNAFILTSLVILIIIGSTVCLIAFTNLREFIPGYPDVEMRKNILISAIRLDSLERELELRDKYFANLNAVISGRRPEEITISSDTGRKYSNIEFRNIPETNQLISQVEEEEKYNLIFTRTNESSGLADLHFFTPVKGIVTGKFDSRIKHFGTDIVTRPGSTVLAALNGTVIFTGWTMETGYVIELQHNNNLVTVYKHNASLLKENGDFVRAGEAISVVGSTGELYTSGPHLHFEIWYKGIPLDPEKHIFF
ncbi:MAG: M23 family metallopeptidase [Bacteroidales bacterium]|nr:M23 family metallopeptidase [Bacteroidales bacterium]